MREMKESVIDVMRGDGNETLLKLVHFEFERFFKIYLALIGF